MTTHYYHYEILALIRKHSGKPTQHTFLDSYLGNQHPRYPINVPTLRSLAKGWMKAHRDLSAGVFKKVLTSLVQGKSSTEKCMTGILLDLSTRPQRKFDPGVFDQWLEHLVGWAEVDSVCTGAYTRFEIAENWNRWKKLLVQFSKSKNINKRRASIVLLCSPLQGARDVRLVQMAFHNIDRLKGEKEILITKAVSWVLRSAVKHHKSEVKKYVALNKDSLPSIAVRETVTVLKTGKKTSPIPIGAKTKIS